MLPGNCHFARGSIDFDRAIVEVARQGSAPLANAAAWRAELARAVITTSNVRRPNPKRRRVAGDAAGLHHSSLFRSAIISADGTAL